MTEKETITTGKLYSNLFMRLKNLILQPGKEWQIIRNENKNINDIITEFSLPLIALCALATFFNFTVNRQGFNLELAIKQSIITFTALFGGLFLAWIILKASHSKLRIENKNNLAFKITAYASGLLYIISFITNLIPELFLFHLVTFYSLFIIWKAIEPEKMPGTEQKSIITIYIAVLIHFIPYFVRYLLINLIIL
ncbi:YIP1 family protein [Natronoflexus pectinivorans]|uniref:Yip1 domain-containing protein n=1 Tax=Natronoflexus pectinivorans TaxID=682526 RepID=A0A4R2GGM6_9BACT|nr:YIP1 family protein [Natronoflexus pectinivorans]TCO07407.1 hypothetical protein EV194_10812 [Natronoflexus pectinivorans]